MPHKKPFLIAVTTVIAFAASLQAYSAPVSFEFTKVADTSTPIPGGIGTFDGFDFSLDVSTVGAGPSIHNGQVAFNGGTLQSGPSGALQRGVYVWNSGTLSLVADRNTVIPSDPQNGKFANFSNPVIENGVAAFSGNNGGGLYRTSGSSLTRIVDTNQTIPGTTASFTSLGQAIGGGELAFRSGPGAGGGSLFKTDIGQLVKIMDINTTVPGTTSTFNGAMSYPDIDNGQVVFSGTGSPGSLGGIFLGNGNTLTTVVNQDTLIPGGLTPGATFSTGFGSPVTDNGQVAFYATPGRDNGIYLFDGQSVQLIADIETLLPDPKGNVTTFQNAFEDPAIDNGVVAFAAGTQNGVNSSGHPRGGLYSTFGGELGKVIDADDVLDGKDLAAVFMGQHGLDGNSLTFYAWFQDGSEGIYVAKANLTAVPLPGVAWLMLSGIVSIMAFNRRKP